MNRFVYERKAKSFPDVVNEYGFLVDDHGCKVFGVIGEKNIKEEVESYRGLVDYSIIMKELNPPISSFDEMSDYMEQFQGVDFSDPLTVVAVSETLKNDFDSLPLEIRKKYANDPTKFTADFIGGGIASELTQEQKRRDKAVDEVSRVVNDRTQKLADLEREVERLKQEVRGTEGGQK